MTRPLGRETFAASVWLLLATLLVASASYAGLNWFGQQCGGRGVALATFAACIAFIPPLWFEFLIGPTVASPLATVVWRLGILLPTVLLTRYEIEAERNCALMTLLACYLMILPLESWLLIRQSRPS